MPSIVATIFTQKSISDERIANDFFQKLNEVGLLPDKIGLYEPLKEQYTLEGAIKMWTKEEPGCYEDGVGMIGKAGSIIGKTKESNFRFDMHWWKHPSNKSINNIRFYMPQKTFSKKRDELLEVFKDTLIQFNAVYGYITHEIPQDRQHVTGTIKTRLPGIFWCNFFGSVYEDFFQKEILLSFPWYKIDKIDALGAMYFLSEYPHRELIQSEELERKAKTHLGIDSFGDISEYVKNPIKIQHKRVPQLE